MIAGSIPAGLEKIISKREKNGELRYLKLRKGIDFYSNDYLGYATENLLYSLNENIEKNNYSGSTGSRLISGNTQYCEQLEATIAKHHKAQSALIYNSGYNANLGLFSSILIKNSLVLYDELCHASIIDGIRLGLGKAFKFKHNSILHLEELLHRHNVEYDSVYIAVESVYSMDGDVAPLTEILSVIEKYENVFLIVDEAHALGIYGKEGLGMCEALGIENKCFARIYTFGKAMGCHGAAILGSTKLINYLINFSRPFIYTTALPTHALLLIKNAYSNLSKAINRNNLLDNISYFVKNSSQVKGLIQSSSAIQCVIIGDSKKTIYLEQKLYKENILVKAVLSPTVKASQERIRICLHSFNSHSQIDKLLLFF
ncbi:MAG: pyridoxal phosphate-dependent aminotransferase family protein [Bacteroidetes bacterium]|nr:pyridoxal phosphate-dependent aminotransferase family protein [Bacteroidota bacterium]